MSLQLNNFLSHKSTKIDFWDRKKLLIDGKSGSGKSSIVEGIVWGLYGKGRVDNRSLIKRGAEKAEVQVELVDQDKNCKYLVIRSITKKGTHKLDILQKSEGKDPFPVEYEGTKQLQSFIEREMLRSSYLLFINSVIYPQDNIETFVKQNAAKRKDLILEIVNAAAYDEYLEKTKAKLSEEKEQVSGKVGQLEANQQSITQHKDRAAQLPEFEKQEAEIEASTKKADEEVKAIELKIYHYKDYLGQRKLKLEQIDQLKEKIHANTTELDAEQTKQNTLKELNIDEITSNYQRLQDIRKELIPLNNQRTALVKWKESRLSINDLNRIEFLEKVDVRIKSLNEKIMEIMKQETPRCHKCNEPVKVFAEEKQKRIDELSNELKQEQTQKDEAAQKSNEWAKKIQELGPEPKVNYDRINKLEAESAGLLKYEELYKNAQNQEQELKDSVALTSRLEEENKTMQIAISKLQEEADKLNYTDVLAETENKLTNFRITLQSKAMELSTARTNTALAREAQEQVKRLTDANQAIEAEVKEGKELIDALGVLKEAFGNNGIKAIVIDHIIPRLEERINDILSKLSDFQVRLDTQKTGVGGENMLEGLFITIFNELGEEFDFDNYSGGERLKIIVAISEALAEVQKVGFRILDELFIGLDEESTEKFAEVLTALQERFQQLVCISHLRSIKDLFHDKLTVVKTNGISVVSTE